MNDQFVPCVPTARAVSVAVVPPATAPATVPSESERARIARNWDTLVAARDISENATLLHVQQTSDFEVVVEPSVTYRDIVGMRYCGTPHSAPFRALSAMAVLRTSDDHVLLFERDSGDWSRSYECPGGFVRAATVPATVTDFITDRVTREVHALTPERYELVGRYEFATILEHMYVYAVTVTETAAAARARYGDHVFPIATADIPASVTGTHVGTYPLHPPSRQVLAALQTVSTSVSAGLSA